LTYAHYDKDKNKAINDVFFLTKATKQKMARHYEQLDNQQTVTLKRHYVQID